MERREEPVANSADQGYKVVLTQLSLSRMKRCLGVFAPLQALAGRSALQIHGLLVSVRLFLLAGSVFAVGTSSDAATAEVEPNNSPATATPIALAGGVVRVSGAISPSGDADYFSFTAPPGAKVWMLVDTGGAQNPGADSRDSYLTLFAGNGTTEIEEDDDDGSGNGCDATLEAGGEFASAIAGRTLVAGGTYYLRVSEFSDQGVISPYTLFIAVSTTSPVAEVESNDTPATANAITLAGAAVGVRSGAINSAGDQDVFSVAAMAGSTLFVNADADPERDAVGTSLLVELLATNRTTVLFSAGPSGRPDSPGNGFCYTVPVTGTYYVRLKHTGTGTGTYHLMVGGSGPGTLEFSAPVFSRVESGGSASITVTRAGGSSGSVSVQFATSSGSATAGTDYTNTSRTLTFADGVTTQTVIVPIIDDGVQESNETVLLTLSMPTGGATISGPNPATLVILDNDGPPDNSAATATALDLSSGFATASVSSGSIPLSVSPPGDQDWFFFDARPGAKVWAFVDTGGSQNPGANSGDARLALIGTNGSTVIEEDDDDGSGNGCDATLDQDGELAPAIAGRTLAVGGRYYLQVQAAATNQIIDPYRLFVALTTLPALSEVELNDTAGFANGLVTATTPVGQRLGQINIPGDTDMYSIIAPSNCLVYVNADCDPERDGVSTDLMIELIGVDGTNVLFSADSSGTEPSAAEAFCFQLAQTGRYFVRVRHFSAAGTGTYNLMVARSPSEMEPNDAVGAATSLDLVSQFAIVTGAIASAGDNDYYAFVAPPGVRLWANLDTGGAQRPGATSRNSLLALLAANGSTVIEEDDNDGSGNGCDATLESADASAIAGRTLVSGGNYFLRVREAAGTGVINPYRLFAVLTSISPSSESETNDTSGSANPIVTVGSSLGLRSGTISTADDADYYSVVASAGDTLLISVDADPERDGLGTDIQADLLAPDGGTELFSANSSTAGSFSDPAAETFCFVAPESGTYFVRISRASGGGDTYHLMVARDRTELRIVDMRLLGANVSLNYTTMAGRNYRVERSAGLGAPVIWTPLQTSPGNGAVMPYVDPAGAGQPQRYYRVIQVP
jgi:hypothetical protein